MTATTVRRRGLWLSGLCALVGFAILIALGTWQIERKAWKEALIADLTMRFAAPAVPLAAPTDWSNLSADRDEFRRVSVTAEFLHDKEALVYTTGSALRADVHGVGYWVFTPARVAGGTIMINRGFVPEGRQNSQSRADGQLTGPVEITGVLRWPETAGLFTPKDEPAKNLWFSRDPAGMAAAKGLTGPVAPFYIEQESPASPGGLPAVGVLRPSLPNNHLGYAITWYGLALTLVGVYGAWLVGRWRGRSGSAAILVQSRPPD